MIVKTEMIPRFGCVIDNRINTHFGLYICSDKMTIDLMFYILEGDSYISSPHILSSQKNYRNNNTTRKRLSTENVRKKCYK